MGVKGFVEGGIASIVAGCSTHPLDLIKVRMQLQGETQVPNPNPAVQTLRPALAFQTTTTTASSAIHMPPPPPSAAARVGPVATGIKIFQTEGVAALFSGVSATILRQTLYSTTRMGLYDILKQKWTNKETKTMPLPRKIAAGLIAGGIGAAVGNPADVAMVRMQADGRLPLSQRRNYTSVVDAIARMSKQEGVTSLWRGSSLTVNRAMLVTASQLASYDQIKETILANGLMKDGLGTHVAASFSAGFVAAESRRRDQDKGYEHEGGAWAKAAVCRRFGLRPEDCEGGRADGLVQRIYTDDLEAGAVHGGAFRYVGTGSEAAEGFLKHWRQQRYDDENKS